MNSNATSPSKSGKMRQMPETPKKGPSSQLRATNHEPSGSIRYKLREEKPTVMRSLFGRPEPNETSKWLEELEEKYIEEKNIKWGFDFRAGKPLQPSTSTIQYEAIDEKDAPEFYHTRTRSTSNVKKLVHGKSAPIKSPTPTRNESSSSRLTRNVLSAPVETKQSKSSNRKRPFPSDSHKTPSKPAKTRPT